MSHNVPSRKVVQIEYKPYHSGQGPSLYALCDDGTMWVLVESWPDGKWQRGWVEIEAVPA